MWIRLMAYVPHQPVVRRLEYVMKRNRKLDGTQVGRQVPTSTRDGLQDELAQLVSQLFELSAIQATQVGRRINLFEADVAHC